MDGKNCSKNSATNNRCHDLIDARDSDDFINLIKNYLGKQVDKLNMIKTTMVTTKDVPDFSRNSRGETKR